MSVTKTPPAVRRMLLDNAQHRNRSALYQCAGCRKYFPAPALQVDHIVPEVDSTPEQRTDPANLQLLCAPKGSNRWTSCHKKKTAKEHAARAKLNRVPFRWGPAAAYGSCASVVAGYTWFDVMVQDSDAAMSWALWSSVAWAVGFSTYLVQKGFRRRRPRKANSPEPVSDDGPRLDTDRIVEAAREAVGPKGDVRVTNEQGLSSFTLNYSGTGYPDHDGEKKFLLQEKITAKIGDRWVVDWDTMNDRAVFTRRPALPKKVHHPGLDPDRAWHVLPIADGAAFDLLVTPHVLIAGETMSGKTAMIRAMIIAASQSAAKHGDVKINLADPKRIEMMGFRGWPGVRDIVTDPRDLWDFAFEQKEEMDRRYSLIAARKAKASDFDRIINFWDEQEEFYNAVFNLWSGGEKDSEGEPFKRPGERTPGAIRAVASVLAMSRRCGMHNIIATQSPDALIFGKSGVRQNMPGRASVGSIDSIRANWLYGDSSVGRDVPSNAKGRATIQIGDGKPFEVQTYWVPDPADGDANYSNTEEDWATLLRLGMPTTYLPEKFKGLIAA